MSRPWNSVLRLVVATDRVEASLRGGWPGRAPLARAERVVERGAADADPGAALARAMDGAVQDVAALAPLHGAWLDVELPSALLHLDVAEGEFADRTARQLHDIASACLAEILGDAAGAHEVRWHLQRDARHLLIVAIEREVLSRLDDVASAAGLRLRSVKPAFVLRWNEFGRAVRPGRTVFAVNTPSDLSIAAIVDGAIACISTSPGLDPQNAAAQRLDARVDRLLAGRGQDPADQAGFVLVAAQAAAIAASARWSVPGADRTSP